jgi:uncharacterized protein
LTRREVQFEAPTWNQIYRLLLKQANKICKSGFKPDIIVGVCRGGWISARILSDLLDNANLASVRVERYVGIGKAKDAKLTQVLSTDVGCKKILVVDEVADSGESLSLAVAHVLERGAEEVKTATLYYKRQSTFKPNYYEKETECWVVFPWEINETVKSIYQTHKTDSTRLKAELSALSEAGVSKRQITHLLCELSEAKSC